MTSRDIAIPDDQLARLRRFFPDALGRGWISGSPHQLKAEIAKMERRREIVALRQFQKASQNGRVLNVPYIRMRTRGSVLRTRALLAGAMGVGAGSFLATVAWLVWESRYVIFTAAGIIVVTPLLLAAARHWKNGCPGIHCNNWGG